MWSHDPSLILQIWVKIIEWSYDPGNGIPDDPMIWEKASILIPWSPLKVYRDPWSENPWSYEYDPNYWYDLVNMIPTFCMIQFFWIINFHDHVSMISAITMIHDFLGFRPWSLMAGFCIFNYNVCFVSFLKYYFQEKIKNKMQLQSGTSPL